MNYQAIRNRISPHSVFVINALLIALASRILLTFANWYTLVVLPMVPNFNPGIPDSYIPDAPWLDGWARWDSSHYVMLATDGYGPAGSSREGQGVGFFPALPLAMRWLSTIFGDPNNSRHNAISGIVIANVCFLISVVLLALLAKSLQGPNIALTTIALFSFSPISFFFSAAYTESIFVMAVIGTFLLAEKQKWAGSACMIFLASATRLFGLFLIPAVLYMMWKKKESARNYIPVLVIAPLGTASYFGWLWYEYGTPFAYFDAQSNWGDWHVRVGTYINQTIDAPFTMISDPMRTIIVLYVLIALAFLATLPLAWKSTTKAIAGFSTFMVVFHLFYTWNSLGRYMLPAIGCFIGLAWFMHQDHCPKIIKEALLPSSAILMTTLCILYAHGYWVI